MIFTKEVCAAEDTVLFGKYQILRVLGSGRTGTVFLAVHRELEELRAIKRVPKTFVDYQRFKQEALILKGLRHPGIPAVYDLEEDSRYSYLIEEYLEGESFYDLIHNQGHLTEVMTVRYGIQICRLVNYLHSAGEIPILYLDLQPKNLLLCHETVKLIDFDHSAPIDRANDSSDRYGTIGCAAPEQYEPGRILDERTDIYAIGVILCFLGTGRYPEESPSYGACGISRGLVKIIQTCTDKEPKRRFPSAEALEKALLRLEKHKNGVFNYFKRNQISSLTIALVGSKAGAGTTHAAIGLSAYLWRHGYPNLYEEQNESGAAYRLGACYGVHADRYGLMRIRGCVIKPQYGEAVALEQKSYRILVQDYGSGQERLGLCRAADWKILVCDGSPWEIERSEASAAAADDSEHLRILFNHAGPGIRLKENKVLNRNQCFKMPWQPDPFLACSDAERMYEALIKSLGIRTGGMGLLGGWTSAVKSVLNPAKRDR